MKWQNRNDVLYLEQWKGGKENNNHKLGFTYDCDGECTCCHVWRDFFVTRWTVDIELADRQISWLYITHDVCMIQLSPLFGKGITWRKQVLVVRWKWCFILASFFKWGLPSRIGIIEVPPPTEPPYALKIFFSLLSFKRFDRFFGTGVWPQRMSKRQSHRFSV